MVTPVIFPPAFRVLPTHSEFLVSSRGDRDFWPNFYIHYLDYSRTAHRRLTRTRLQIPLARRRSSGIAPWRQGSDQKITPRALPSPRQRRVTVFAQLLPYGSFS